MEEVDEERRKNGVQWGDVWWRKWAKKGVKMVYNWVGRCVMDEERRKNGVQWVGGCVMEEVHEEGRKNVVYNEGKRVKDDGGSDRKMR